MLLLTHQINVTLNYVHLRQLDCFIRIICSEIFHILHGSAYCLKIRFRIQGNEELKDASICVWVVKSCDILLIYIDSQVEFSLDLPRSRER